MLGLGSKLLGGGWGGYIGDYLREHYRGYLIKGDTILLLLSVLLFLLFLVLSVFFLLLL